MIKIALDAMGGDNAPQAIVQGALDALGERQDLAITLFGQKEKIEPLLSGAAGLGDRISIVDAREVITMEEAPALAIRHKSDSSIVRALESMRGGENDAVVSAGSTGALLAGGLFRVGRIKGVERPAIATVFPSPKRPYVLLDCGANADCHPEYIVNFALMGSVYMNKVMGYENPTIGLVNIGAESEKGNELAKNTYELLKNSGLNFTGNVEPRDIPAGAVDVAVTDGFTGNVILKLTEGLAKTLFGMLKTELMATPFTKIGAALAKPAFKKIKDGLDPSVVGGAPLLGCKGTIIKAHGSSNAMAIKNALYQAARVVEGDVVNIIEKRVAELTGGENSK